MISTRSLTKRYDEVVAVDDLTFDVEPGRITGFLGPNGSGKSTTMRMILGLDAPTSGEATVAGKRYRDLDNPTRYVGALLDPEAVHTGRTARAHLTWIAQASAVRKSRIDEVLDTVGIAHAADRRIGGFSLGMRQRLAIAAAILGEPEVLILDEPLNGLDPQGIIWLRELLRDHAEAGGTVLISSHLMNEMQKTADHVVVIAKGKLIVSESLDAFERRAEETVAVRSPKLEDLEAVLRGRTGVEITKADDGLTVSGLSSLEIGELALSEHIALSELTTQVASLEAQFIAMTENIDLDRAAEAARETERAGAAEASASERVSS